MKTCQPVLLLLSLLSLTLYGCNADPEPPAAETEVTGTLNTQAAAAGTENKTTDTTTIPVIPLPPVTPEKETAVNDAVNKSELKDVGCCAEESKRSLKCCCDEVAEMYKTWSPEERGKYSSSDPILGQCKRKFKQIFKEIDNPKKAEESLDDLI